MTPNKAFDGSPKGLPFHEFFAGSGLVGYGLEPFFHAVWANDISESKARVYRDNRDGSVLSVGDISDVKGDDLPPAALSWASFPCQDLSLAGKIEGIKAKRSGLVWQWLRIIDEMGPSAPRVICLENVTGLISSHNGDDYRQLHRELSLRGYNTGAIMLNASLFVPQSRPRVFVIGTRNAVPENLTSDAPTWLHNPPLRRVASTLDHFVWWKADKPEPMTQRLSDIVEDAPFDQDEYLQLIPPSHLEKFINSGLKFASAYKRTRNHRQVLEIRCDGLAGCLRTPMGGSSRQYIIKRDDTGIHLRLITTREAARLMGAPDSYILSGTYNDRYMAMGDAVVAPVAHWLAETFLIKLCEE